MSLTEIVWKDACELPLKDAAFQLWRYKDRLDDEEFGAPMFIHFDDAAEQARHMQSIMERSAMSTISPMRGRPSTG